MKQNSKHRFWEMDFLRGLAAVMMVVFHSLFFLDYFAGHNFNLRSGFWAIFQTITATIFIFLVGLSLTLSHSRAKTKLKAEKLFLKYLKRGLKIFSLGLCMTFITWLFLKENFVRFGILHFIGVSIILAYPFLRIHFWNLLLGLSFIALGIYFKGFTLDFGWLIWLGFPKSHYHYAVDYFPLLPWFGITLIGLFFGKCLYKNHTRRFSLADFSDFCIVRPFRFLGRHSLVIYFLHQPVLIGILYFCREVTDAMS